MSLMEELDRLEREAIAPKVCPVARMASEMSEETGQRFLNLVEGRLLSIQALLGILRPEGYRISKDSLSLHRNRRCVCVANG